MLPSAALLTAMIFLGLATACTAPAPPVDEAAKKAGDGGNDNERYWAFQLQLHGSLSEGAGSMAGHNVAARALGNVDGVWWTDHDWRIARHTYLQGFDFEALEQSAEIPHRGTPWSKRPRHIRFGVRPAVRGPEPESSSWGLTSRAFEGQGALALSLEGGASSSSAPSAEPQPGISALQGSFFASGSRFSAPLAAEVTVSLAVAVDSTCSDCEVLVRMKLSLQPEEGDESSSSSKSSLEGSVESSAQNLPAHYPTELRYQIYPPEHPPEQITPFVTQEGTRRVLVIPTPGSSIGRWQQLRFPVSRDVLRYDPLATQAGFRLGGLDNSLRTLTLELRAPKKQIASARFDSLEIDCRRGGEEILQWQLQEARSLEQRYGLVNHVGVEVSYGDHLNAWLPRPELPDFSTHPHGLSPQEALRWASDRGGLVSYNHIFGADIESTPERAGQQRIRGDRVVREGNFGIPILEVGYPLRVLPLREHLKIWDHLSQRGQRVIATGASDSHVQTQGWIDGNNYVTWIWAASSSPADLIQGIDSGRVFFGDPAQFHAGRLDLHTDTGETMGSVVSTSQAHHEVFLQAPHLPPGSQVYFVVGDQRLPAPPPQEGEAYRARLQIDTRQATFVRAEIWKQQRGIAFTNAIYFRPSSQDNDASSIP
ncbi:MAG: CehA/McbA family metallohydrolase [Acidobacteriota bacterium]